MRRWSVMQKNWFAIFKAMVIVRAYQNMTFKYTFQTGGQCATRLGLISQSVLWFTGQGHNASSECQWTFVWMISSEPPNILLLHHDCKKCVSVLWFSQTPSMWSVSNFCMMILSFAIKRGLMVHHRKPVLEKLDCYIQGPRREVRDVWCLPPVWNLRAVIWFHFAISCLVLLPSPVTPLYHIFFCLLVLSSEFFPENSSVFSELLNLLVLLPNLVWWYLEQ